MSRKVITISREFGSGGHEIAWELAEDLKYDFYDKDIIAMVAEESGYAREFVENMGESGAPAFGTIIPDGFSGTYFSPEIVSPQDQLYLVQSRVIIDLAEKGPCVIVGRLADHILKDRFDCLNVFIYSDLEHRIARIMGIEKIDAKKAEKIIHKNDRGRASHRKHYAGQDWHSVSNYHVSLNSGVLGIGPCVEALKQLV